MALQRFIQPELLSKDNAYFCSRLGRLIFCQPTFLFGLYNLHTPDVFKIINGNIVVLFVHKDEYCVQV